MICPFCKKEWKSTIRSNNENRYYWGVVVDILSQELGYTPEEVHEILKFKFIPKRDVLIKDEDFKISRSTTSLTTVEMERYLSEIREWAASYCGISIPEPNEED